MKTYTKPEVEVVEFAAVDTIMSMGGGFVSNPDGGDDDEG